MANELDSIKRLLRSSPEDANIIQEQDWDALVNTLQTALNDRKTASELAALLLLKANLASPAFTGTPSAPTAPLGTNTTQIATMAAIKAAIDNLIASAPGTLDTLDELAAALGDDANFAATVTTALAGKASLASPAFTNTPTAPTATLGTNTTQLATTAFTQQAVAAGALPPGHLFGLTVANNVTDATNDIDVSAGSARDSTNAVGMVLAAALTKRLDANWAAGTNQGMRYSGAAIANGTYHIYLVAKAAGADVDVYADASASEATVLAHLQAETGGSAYLYVRRIFSIVRASAAIRPFVHYGATVLWSSPVADISEPPSTTAALKTLSVPLGIVVAPIVSLFLSIDGNARISSPSQADVSANNNSGQFRSGGSAQQSIPPGYYTNTSAQLRLRCDVTTGTVGINTQGYVDHRGRQF